MKRYLMILILLACSPALAQYQPEKPPLAVAFEAPVLHKFYIFNLSDGIWAAYADPASHETYLGATSRPNTGSLVFLVGGTGMLRLRQADAKCSELPVGLHAAPGWIDNEYGGDGE